MLVFTAQIITDGGQIFAQIKTAPEPKTSASTIVTSTEGPFADRESALVVLDRKLRAKMSSGPHHVIEVSSRRYSEVEAAMAALRAY